MDQQATAIIALETSRASAARELSTEREFQRVRDTQLRALGIEPRPGGRLTQLEQTVASIDLQERWVIEQPAGTIRLEAGAGVLSDAERAFRDRQLAAMRR